MESRVPAEIGKVETEPDTRMEKVPSFLKLVAPVVYQNSCHRLFLYFL
jgi:hypothetical protein